MRSSQDEMINAIKVLLNGIKGEDCHRKGLLETPARYVKALQELTAGYEQNPADILSKRFDMDDVGHEGGSIRYNGMVLLRDIYFHSLCEHHLLPFTGKAHVGYIPGEDGKVLGLSKLARLVEIYARRLQCQERLTAQIADALEHYANVHGALVVIESHHMCMSMRGVRKQNSAMITSEARGVFKESKKARSEALCLLLRGKVK